MMDIERVRGALQVIQAATGGTNGSNMDWNLGWRNAIEKINVREVMKSCKELSFSGDDRDKREAKIVKRLVSRGFELSKQVSEVEYDLANLYPVEEAKRRLKEELGWEDVEGDTIKTKLDRSCMIAIVRAPALQVLRANVHAILRGRFSDLESSESE